MTINFQKEKKNNNNKTKKTNSYTLIKGSENKGILLENNKIQKKHRTQTMGILLGLPIVEQQQQQYQQQRLSEIQNLLESFHFRRVKVM